MPDWLLGSCGSKAGDDLFTPVTYFGFAQRCLHVSGSVEGQVWGRPPHPSLSDGPSQQGWKHYFLHACCLQRHDGKLRHTSDLQHTLTENPGEKQASRPPPQQHSLKMEGGGNGRHEQPSNIKEESSGSWLPHTGLFSAPVQTGEGWKENRQKKGKVTSMQIF